MFRKQLHPQVLSRSSECPLPSPAEDGGLFFEINRGFPDSETPGMTENIPTKLKTGELKNIHLHSGYRGSTGHSEYQTSRPCPPARDRTPTWLRRKVSWFKNTPWHLRFLKKKAQPASTSSSKAHGHRIPPALRFLSVCRYTRITRQLEKAPKLNNKCLIKQLLRNRDCVGRRKVLKRISLISSKRQHYNHKTGCYQKGY